MSNGGHPIAESLQRRRVGYVCHMTPCDRLPSIIQSGGIFSRTRRAEHLIAEPNEPHYWGTPGKAEDLADYVVCGFMAPWWMCKGHTEELAIIVLDAKAVCCGEGVLFCPTNSARNDYAAGEIKKRSGIEFFDACFPNLDTYQAGDSEIFVPDWCLRTTSGGSSSATNKRWTIGCQSCKRPLPRHHRRRNILKNLSKWERAPYCGFGSPAISLQPQGYDHDLLSDRRVILSKPLERGRALPGCRGLASRCGCGRRSRVDHRVRAWERSSPKRSEERRVGKECRCRRARDR